MKIALVFVAIVMFLGCTGNHEQTESDQQATDETTSGQYTLTPVTDSPEFPDATLKSMEYNFSTMTFSITGDSYELGVQTPDAATKGCANSGQGQHIHLIVDSLPYAAKYEPIFNYDIENGEHYILAFLSRSYHESIKTHSAHIAVKATIANKSIEESAPIEEPMLFYSRPKGVYEGEDTKLVMLDYYLVNTDDGDYSVRADINGQIHELDTWQPYYIEGLPAGENTITLTLLDAQGRVVDAPLNPVTRKITLTPDPTSG